MVQVDDDVYILDRCVRVGEKTHPLELYTFVNGVMSDSLHIYRSDDGNAFQVCDTHDFVSVVVYLSLQYRVQGYCPLRTANMHNVKRDNIKRAVMLENWSLGFPTRSDTNQFVQPQRMTRSLKIRI